VTALIALLPLAAVLFQQGPADLTVVLQGRPTTKIESAEDLTVRTELPAAERGGLAVRIVRKGGRYYWASRENQELVRRVSGAFHYYVDPAGGGYVRVFDTSTLAESLRPDGPRFQYMEHVPLFKGTVTFFGGADSFDD
jgi:hypothetical protein